MEGLDPVQKEIEEKIEVSDPGQIILSKEAMSGCSDKGYKMKPHPICALRHMAVEGLSKEEANKKCLEDQKFHGISKLKCLAISKGITS